MPPSAFHELLIELFRERPSLASMLLQPMLQQPLPMEGLRVSEAAFTQIAPTEFTADLVLLAGEPPTLGIIVEVQRARSAKKYYSWPLYACALRSRWHCPAVVLVLAPDPTVAVWADAPIVLGPGGSIFRPQVVRLEDVPWVTSAEEACAAPELAVLSALAHGNAPDGLKVLMAAFEGIETLREDTAKLYYDWVDSRLTEAVRQAMEDTMKNKLGYEYQSDFARKYVAQGLAEGKAEGLAQGNANGKVEEARRLVLRMLARRCGLLGQELQARVEVLELDRLESLADALLDFTTVENLQAWLAQAPLANP